MKTTQHIGVIALHFALLTGYTHGNPLGSQVAPPTPGFPIAKLRPPIFPSSTGEVSSCGKSDQATIKKWLTEALKMVQYVVDVRSALGTLNPAYRTFIDFQGEQKTLEYVTNTFTSMKEGLAEGTEGKTLYVKCVEDKKCNDQNFIIAGSDENNNILHFCPKNFPGIAKKVANQLGLSKAPEPFENFRCTKSGENLIFDYVAARLDPNNIDALSAMPSLQILRELSRFHKPEAEREYSMLTCFHGPYAAEYMARRKPSAARMNADNYAYFAVANYVGFLCARRPSTNQQSLRSSLDGQARDLFEKEWNEFSRKAPDAAKELHDEKIFGLHATSFEDIAHLTDEEIESSVISNPEIAEKHQAAEISFRKYLRNNAIEKKKNLALVGAEQYRVDTCNLGPAANANDGKPEISLTWKKIEEQMRQRGAASKI